MYVVAGRPSSLTELLELCRTLPLPREYVKEEEEEGEVSLRSSSRLFFLF